MDCLQATVGVEGWRGKHSFFFCQFIPVKRFDLAESLAASRGLSGSRGAAGMTWAGASVRAGSFRGLSAICLHCFDAAANDVALARLCARRDLSKRLVSGVPFVPVCPLPAGPTSWSAGGRSWPGAHHSDAGAHCCWG